MENTRESLQADAAFVLSEAQRLGATDCDVTIRMANTIDPIVRDAEPISVESRISMNVKIRAFVGGAHAQRTLHNLRHDNLIRALSIVIEQAKLTEPDESVGLPDSQYLAAQSPNLELFDPAVAALDSEAMIEMTVRADEAARKFDPRVVSGRGAGVGIAVITNVYANSRGFIGAYDETVISLDAQMMAKDGDDMQSGAWGTARRFLADIPTPESIGVEAARRAVEQFGSKKVDSGIFPVVFSPEVASRILGEFAGAATGNHQVMKSSFLSDKQNGDRVAHESVRIVDNALLPRGLGSKPFTADGVKTGVRTIVENGLLVDRFVDTYAGRRLGIVPNGGSRTNLSLIAGTKSREDIIASVESGLYVNTLLGQPGNPVTGSWSMGAAGIWIKDGKLTIPVAEITVAGNLLTMFQSIEAIGNDPHYAATSSPTVKIGGITVGGN